MSISADTVRLEGAIKRRNKAINSIDRLTNLIEKKKARIASGKEESNRYPSGEYFLEGEIEFHREDIERAEKELRNANTSIESLKAKINEEQQKIDSLPHVEDVERFLQEWKDRVFEYYCEGIEKYRTWYSETGRYIDDWKEKRNAIKRFPQDIVQFASYGDYKKRVMDMLERDVINKRVDLFFRCSAQVGLITDASNIHVGNNGSLNGIVIGELGKAYIETIDAEGPVQRYHYRVLVKKIS